MIKILTTAIIVATIAAVSPSSCGADPKNNHIPITDQSAPSIDNGYYPKVEDFDLEVLILDKKCSGSDGCDIEYRIKMSYHGQPLDPDVRYTVTYEVSGGKDGPSINFLTLRGDSYSVDSIERDEIASSDIVLKAKVTKIVEG